jgi:hypothetical protein
MAGGIKWLALIFGAMLLLATEITFLPAYAKSASSSSPPSSSSSSSSIVVTTNKGLYDLNDRVIIAGTVNRSSDSSSHQFVTINITKDDLVCTQQFVRVARDGSFISRPLKVSCGVGEYLVTAIYAGDLATTSFTIVDVSAQQQSDETGKIQETLVEARDKANERIKELANSNIPIPEQAAEKYRLGVSEASLAIQAAEHNDIDTARDHMNAALSYFEETVSLLSPENVRTLSPVADEDTERRLAAARDWLGRLSEIYRNLVSLAEKNGVSDDVFSDIRSLIAEANRLVSVRDVNSVESTLAVAEKVIDKAREKLVEQGDVNSTNDNSDSNNSISRNNNSNDANTSDNSNDTSESRNLSASADRLQKRAEKQLADANGNSAVEDKIREATSFIEKARTAIADDDYTSARQSLSSASRILIETSELIHRQG